MTGDAVRYVMLVGGPADGEVMKVDTSEDVLVVREAIATSLMTHPRNLGIDPDTMPANPFHRYLQRRIGCPDGWIQPVYVHAGMPPSVLALYEEKHLIRFVMEPWRATHRRRQ